jgi:hypothetical protein
MDATEIIRLNVERYRRMLRTDLDEITRRTIQGLLGEFEAKLPLQQKMGQRDADLTHIKTKADGSD